MKALPPIRAVITGGPGAGKSTLLSALADSGIKVFPEVARMLLQAPDGMAMRAGDPARFADLMLAAERKAWNAAPPGLSVYDRGFPDIVGFCELEGLSVPVALDQTCRELRYQGPIFRAPLWPEIYTGDEERIQSWDEAVASDTAVGVAWKHYGYQLVNLPLAPVTDRVAFIVEQLKLQAKEAGGHDR
jgi:predicted ATPase